MKSAHIQRIREFNRFYTNVIGLLENHILDSPYSLPEARILYELYNNQPCTSSHILETVDMDKGYLSRVLKSFESRKLLNKKQDGSDKRAVTLHLTAKGKLEFEKINKASARQMEELFSRLTQSEIKESIQLMEKLQAIISKTKP